MKRCSTSYVIRKMQIKATMRCNSLSEWPKSETLPANAGEGVEKQEIVYFWGGCKMVQPLGKIVWQFLTKLNMLLRPSNLISGH